MSIKEEYERHLKAMIEQKKELEKVIQRQEKLMQEINEDISLAKDTIRSIEEEIEETIEFINQEVYKSDNKV